MTAALGDTSVVWLPRVVLGGQRIGVHISHTSLGCPPLPHHQLKNWETTVAVLAAASMQAVVDVSFFNP